MKGDFSKTTFEPRSHFSSVRLQQGRVVTDADWNEQADLTRHRIEREAVDVIGCCGGPEGYAGFALTPGTFANAVSAFGDDGDITRELTRSLLHGHAVPGLEETFRTLKEAYAVQRGSVAVDAAVAPRPTPEARDTAVVVRAATNSEAAQRLEDLRAMKKAEEAKRGKRLTLTRTLAGNPGQLSLFS